MTGYVHSTYGNYISGSALSADIVASALMRVLKPRSVLDVGCGTGVWLEAFKRHGAETVIGLDGSWAPARTRLYSGQFFSVDFEHDDQAMIDAFPSEGIDLVLSLEFLEHVAPERAEWLVDFLCKRGDALLISAAIPLQGGQHHVNEQWPEYWIAKFRNRGFVPFDVLRLAFWNEPGIAPWYRQNMMLFFRGDIPPAVQIWGEAVALRALRVPHAVVHPEFYAKRLGRLLFALSQPLNFLAMLWREKRSGCRMIPPLPGLDRSALGSDGDKKD